MIEQKDKLPQDLELSNLNLDFNKQNFAEDEEKKQIESLEKLFDDDEEKKQI